MENTERNKNIEKLMAHDNETIRINKNNVSHADRAQYIDAKAYRYKIYATIITIIGVIIGAGLIIGGICI
jgi:predicted kinase